ncbi:hypothetical protein OSB04_024647 [Centaurea solstitialis]|uniref:Uncharacterized protein n=1 Tax=Centaurea solstitialis TaxID=347529 RepID=A0AA38WAJ8_9ASTR|nr:hypothetical protein OSB04_024647 [Centaurea solstitialis]
MEWLKWITSSLEEVWFSNHHACRNLTQCLIHRTTTRKDSQTQGVKTETNYIKNTLFIKDEERKEGSLQVRINVALVDLISEIPNYMKFIKEFEPTELVANKTKMGGHVSRKNEEIQGALLFLGILVTKSFVMRLGLSDLGNTRMTIQLADKSIKYPIGITEDVQMQADYFPY